MQSVLHAAAMIPASIPSPSWSGFDIPLPWGALRIHAYALCILAGIIAGLWLTSVRWARRGAPEGSVWDIAIWAIPFGIIGGRLYHVFSSPDAYFGPGFDGTGDLSLIPQIQRGGLGIWGAVVLGAVGAWIGCRRAGVKLSAFMDAAAPGLLLAQAIGRWGNYFNQELFGGPTTLPWGLQIDPNSPNFPAGMPADTLFHPTFLYESLWNLAGVADPAGPGPEIQLPPRPPLLRLRHVLHPWPRLDRGHADRRRRADHPLRDHHQAQCLDQHLRLRRSPARLHPPRTAQALRAGHPVPPGPRTGGGKPVETKSAESKTDAEAADADRTTGASRRADRDRPPTPEPTPRANDAAEGDRATVPADATTVRHADSAVSDSESRDNLRNNQSGPVRASDGCGKDSTGGTAPATGAPAAGVSGRQGTGTAPEAEGTK